MQMEQRHKKEGIQCQDEIVLKCFYYIQLFFSFCPNSLKMSLTMVDYSILLYAGNSSSVYLHWKGLADSLFAPAVSSFALLVLLISNMQCCLYL